MSKFRTFFIPLMTALAAMGYAQQPQTQAAPIFPVNAKYANGVAPGYAPTAGSGLTLNVGAGTAFCAGSVISYAGGTLTMTASVTNYVYLDPTASCAPAASIGAFSTSQIPIATVVAGASTISAITDDRTMFFQSGAGGGGGATVQINGTPESTVNMTGNVTLACADSSGSGTVQSCSTAPTFTPVSPNCITYTTTTTNSGTGLTINVNSLGAKSVAIPSSSGWTTILATAVIPANKPIPLCYDGTNWDAVQTGTAASASVSNTTFTVGTTAIGANTCTTASTVTMTGVATTSAFFITPNADVSGVTGWGSSGGLVIDAWPTANTLNYKVCNQTGSSLTPSASVTFNVGAR